MVTCWQMFLALRFVLTIIICVQRPLWRHYYQNTDALVLVVDSNDRERIGEVKDELDRMLAEDELRDAILLVLANKQDLPGALTALEVTDKLGLTAIRQRTWSKYDLALYFCYYSIAFQWYFKCDANRPIFAEMFISLLVCNQVSVVVMIL